MEVCLGIMKITSLSQILFGFGHLFYMTTFFIKVLAIWCPCIFFFTAALQTW